jgi:hypothetical protein
MDALAAAIWLTVTATVVGLAWSVARRLYPFDAAVQLVMHTVVLTWTWLVVGGCGLGVCGWLSASSLGSVVLILAGTTCWWSRRCRDSEREDDLPPTREEWSTWGTLAGWLGWGSVAPIVAGLVVIRGVMRFPVDWDTLMYHLPLIDLWVQSGSLYVPECAVWHTPGNNELWGLWWAAPFSGDFWVGLINIPAGLLLAIGTFEFARRLGISRLLGQACALAAVGNYVVLLQMTNAKNDVAVAGLFVTGMAYGARALQEDRRRDVVFAGAALGLLAGVKYYALGYAGAAWLALITAWGLRKGGRAAGKWGMLLGAVMLVPAGYWYARNWWNTGAPLYPLGYSGKDAAEVSSRLQGSLVGMSFLGSGRRELWERYVDAVWLEGGACQTAALLVLPFSLLWLMSSEVRSLRAGRESETAGLRAGVVLAALVSWLSFAATPFTVDPENDSLLRSTVLVVRFSLVPQTLSVLALAVALSDVQSWVTQQIGGRAGNCTGGLLPLLFGATALWGFGCAAVRMFDGEWLVLLLAFDAALLLFGIYQLWIIVERWPMTFQWLRTGGCLALGLGGMMAGTQWLSQGWHAGYARHYDLRFGTQAFSRLEAMEPPLPSVAALPFRYYPFFGSRRQFRVHRPLRVMSLDYLFRYLVVNEMDLIAVVHRGGSHPETITSRKLVDWMGEHEGVFEKLEGGNEFDLYRIKRERLTVHLEQAAVEGTDRVGGPSLTGAQPAE